MQVDERERLLRIGLAIVLGDDARSATVIRRGDDVWVSGRDARDHAFGFPPDAVLGDDPATVLARDIDVLGDELSETSMWWAKRLPECPIHPASHALAVAVTGSTVAATCPVSGRVVRTTDF